jgi:hypothetical protein
MPNKCLENISDVLFWKDMVKVKLTLRLINWVLRHKGE